MSVLNQKTIQFLPAEGQAFARELEPAFGPGMAGTLLLAGGLILAGGFVFLTDVVLAGDLEPAEEVVPTLEE